MFKVFAHFCTQPVAAPVAIEPIVPTTFATSTPAMSLTTQMISAVTTPSKVRDMTVVLIVADYRMPIMNGIELLEQAMDIFPAARRMLLTAHASRQAADDAVAAGIDYYMLKPWDPPDEKLYPAIDSLL